MATIDINNGNPVLRFAGAAIDGNTNLGNRFYAGSCGVAGLTLWIKIILANASNITQFKLAIQTTNDPAELLWASTLGTLHDAGGITNVETTINNLTAGDAFFYKLTVDPKHIGSSRTCRVVTKSDATGVVGDLIEVTATGW